LVKRFGFEHRKQTEKLVGWTNFGGFDKDFRGISFEWGWEFIRFI